MRYAGPAALVLLALASCSTREGAPVDADDRGADRDPAYVLREHEAQYRGPGREDPAPADVDVVKIGWFGTDDPDDPAAGDMWRAATLVIEEANREGGLDGTPFRLVPVWSENPWGTGVKEVTRLVYEEHVWALLGSPDGSSAHLVEQVTAKARLPFVNPISTDKSTNLANVPWIFSCAPGDHRIAPLLAATLVREAGGEAIALVSCTDHDSRLTAQELRAALEDAAATVHAHLQFHPGAESFASPLRGLRDVEAGAVAVIAGPVDGARFVRALREEGIAASVVGGPALGRLSFAREAGPAADGVLLPLLWDPDAPDSAGESFRRRFAERAGHDPDYAAAHAHDATAILVAAIRRVGLNRARIRDALRALSPWSGVTGAIVWDPTGHNARPVSLGTIRDGRIVRAESPLPGGVR